MHKASSWFLVLISSLFLLSAEGYANQPSLIKTLVQTQANKIPAQAPTPPPMIIQAPVLINRAVAIVNDQVITQSELDQALQETLGQARMSGITPPSVDQIRPQVLDQLILQKIALQMAALNHITASDQDVDQSIAEICQQNNTTAKNLQAVLSANGIPFDQYREILKNKLIIRKLEESAVASSIVISDQDVSNYLNNQNKNAHPDVQYTLSHILISAPDNPTPQDLDQAKAKANSVLKQIQQGLDFTTAAMRYSQADDALQGGLIKDKTLDQLPTLFEQPLETMKAGDIVGPIQSDNGFYLLKLISEKNDQSQDHFVTQYHLQIIMLKTSPILSSSQAHTQMLGIYNSLKNGSSFDKLAEANSEDYASSSQGGDLGWVTPSDMPMGVGAEVVNMKEGQISEPFNLGNQWFLVKLLGQRQQNDTQAYEDSQARDALFQQKAEKAVEAWQTKLKAESYIKILAD